MEAGAGKQKGMAGKQQDILKRLNPPIWYKRLRSSSPTPRSTQVRNKPHILNIWRLN